ncbi:TNFAIP3-interacting protein 3-like isoform X2 [Mauremys reevesii]|uniref:TNFAIP3-interacting protein 3-like isoform X2 n=1 Tax=Mauremys reevesii TaxID=260615 RepID=UPI00193FBABF|nr:TNFAIP3-interacting protein 3-like isoform X2 [Mauremys reevesii]
METGPLLALPPDKAELLPELQRGAPPLDFCLEQGPGLARPQDALALNREGDPRVLSEPVISNQHDSEEIVTYISESMTVTSADEEKLLLLNKNTELRRINKELMKLNQEWDQIYHTTTLGLQQKMGALQQEVVILKQQTERLSMKLEHEQNKREYYEQTLIQELKKNQHLQEYVRQLEGRQHHGREKRTSAGSEVLASVPWEEFVDAQFPLPRKNLKENSPKKHEEASQKVQGGETYKPRKCKHLAQTEIYEADYRTEHKDRERIKAENEKLRKKEEEMRQQMALLQEQLKIFEDDFRKERSDKQLLQRLLKSKASPKEPILVHRCNSQERPVVPASPAHSTSSTSKRGNCSKHCEKHSHKQGECAKHHSRDAEVQASPFSRDY